ncbi:MAG: YabP/YqfC family sporulation protein [Aristaeellaceae bacterium]
MAVQELFPREVISGLPHMTLTGAERFHIEQHRGLIAYQPDEIVFLSEAGLVRVLGNALHFSMYTAAEALVSGEIHSIVIDRTGGFK